MGPHGSSQAAGFGGIARQRPGGLARSDRDAAAEAVSQMEKLGGTGGLAAIDRHANVAMPFNTPGMYRGCRVAGRAPVVEIFGGDKV